MGKNHQRMAAFAVSLASLGLVSCMGISPSAFYEQQEVQRYQVIDHALQANVMIFYGKQGGSGVLYSKNGKQYVLTAAHNLLDPVDEECLIANSITHGTQKAIVIGVNQVNNIEFSASGKCVFIDTMVDFAILELEGTNHEIKNSEFHYGDTRIGDRVFTVGNSALDINTVATGIVQHGKRISMHGDGQVEYIQTDCAGGVGLSGGGLYREIDGKCIGIVVMKNDRSQSLYAVPIKKIREVIGNSERKDVCP